MNLKQRNEALANDIKDFIMRKGLGVDTRIYFNGKCYDWGVGYYNKEPNLIEDIRPSRYFEYANDETVSMSFEGDLYDYLNYGFEIGYDIEEEFKEIFEKHGCYYEKGHAWNLSVEYLD